MKINISKSVITRKNVIKTVECSRFVQVPGWVWPFACDKCGWEIEKDDIQIIAEIDDEIMHYHNSCWTNLINESVKEEHK